MSSRFFQVPLRIEGDITLETVVTGSLRCGAPTLIGASGHLADATPATAVAYEWPEPYKPHDTKASKESQHFNRFCVDFRQGRGRDPYVDIEAFGTPRPDFMAADERGAIGVECTQLISQDRLEADVHFGAVRSELQQLGKKRLGHLRGRVVYVSFDVASGSKLPLNKPETMQEVVAAVERFEPLDPDYRVMPDRLDPRLVLEFPGGRITSALLSQAPSSSPFYGFLGFEIALAYSTIVREDEAWNRVQKLVHQHDYVGVDDLIISARAPTVAGFAYPSDSVVAQAVLNRAEDAHLEADHVGQVFVHDWSSRGIFRLIPASSGAQRLCGDMPMPSAASP